MIILGFYGRTLEQGRSLIVHDAGVSLFINGQQICSLQAERMTRVKEEDRFPRETIDVVLEAAKLTPEQVDLVAVAQSPVMLRIGRDRVAQHLARTFPRSKFSFISHHNAHCAATFFASSFDRATVVSFDNGGDWFPLNLKKGTDDFESEIEMAVFGVGLRTVGLKIIHRARSSPIHRHDPWRLGTFYQHFSKYCYERIAPERARNLGSRPADGEECKLVGIRNSSLPGKIMGLAAHGNWRNVDLPAPFHLDNNGIDLPMLYVSAPMSELLNASTAKIDRFRVEDVAAWFQKCFEDALVAFFKAWPFREKNLCLAGGCALNVLANRRILDEGLFEDLFVFPGASDCGLCVGAAAYASWLYEKKVEFPENVAALGLSYSQRQVEQAFQQAGLNPTVMQSDEQMIEAVADRLIKGKTIGWHQGRSEFGPRALGFRSMLADPRRPDIRDHINFMIKDREWWRPLAPVVLEEDSPIWFEIDRPSPYMLLSAKVRDGFREKVPGIVHVDGTARVQTVNEKQNPLVYKLLQRFKQQTGVPMLLNTSFNTDGEPIVETPSDAIKTFLRCGLDTLVIGRCVLDR